jgi:hypothetical protein
MSDTTTASAESAVRPFRIEVPQGEIDELRRRINATRWPTRGTRHRSVAGCAIGGDTEPRRATSTSSRLPRGAAR